jgi:acetyl-CoA carboxylase carboxyltransferase component
MSCETVKKEWQKINCSVLQEADKSKVAKQKSLGKNTARHRLEMILDAGSFEEVDRLATSYFLKSKIYTDGVVTGFGTVAGKKVAIYAQDFTIKGGSLGKRHAEKICKIMDMAAKIGCPIIGIIDSGGARIDEGIHALSGYGKIFMRNVRYSGVVPQISLILGPCAGGASYSPALTDFVFMVKDISQMFITGPQVVSQILNQTVDKNELGGASVHGIKSGCAQIISNSEQETIEKLKLLLELLPSNYRSNNGLRVSDGNEAATKNLKSLVPENVNKPYDIKNVIIAISDDSEFFEIHDAFARNIVVGFIRIGRITVGIVANQPAIKAGSIDIDASCKAARFINFCNNFSIPIVSLVDVPGFFPGVDQEHAGIIRHGAKLIYAYANATVPKITVILRKSYGGAYIVMGSKELGADFNFAWPSAQIAVLGAQGAVTIMHGKTLAKEAEEQKRFLREGLEKQYEKDFLHPFIAAESGYIDSIIEPDETRIRIIKALKISESKVETLPKRKNGNIPM